MAEENKRIKNEKLYIIGAIVIALVLLIFFLYGLNKNKQVPDDFDFYFEDVCRCLERDRLKCSNGFELDEERRACIKEGEYTNVLLGCSKYECSGDLYDFNFEKDKWELEE